MDGWRSIYVGSRVHDLDLAECIAQTSVLDPQLVDEGTAFFPTPVRCFGSDEGIVEQLRAGFECFDMAAELISDD